MTDSKPLLSRRQVLRQVLGTSFSLPFAKYLPALSINSRPSTSAAGAAAVSGLSAEDDQFLNDVEAASFLFFWEQGNPKTGMVKDRCNVHDVDKNDQKVASSIAATGFGLTALCIGQQRGFISNDDALERVFATLRFLWRKLPNHRGFFYHFANPETGERMFDSEVSSVDTAILLCGVLTCREHFQASPSQLKRFFDEETALGVGVNMKTSRNGVRRNGGQASPAPYSRPVFVKARALHATLRLSGLHEGLPDKAGAQILRH